METNQDEMPTGLGAMNQPKGMGNACQNAPPLTDSEGLSSQACLFLCQEV